MSKFWNIAVIIVGGVIVADAVANPKGTGTLFKGINGFWSNSIGGLLGQVPSGYTKAQTSG
ncbi:MAG: hypothetical protein ACYDC0_16315 [Acidimicrobiales bacterium]